MTAPDPSVGEIEARHRVIRRCLEAHPNDSYDMSDLDWAVEEAKDDVPYLLAELRKAREALTRVEELHAPVIEDGDPVGCALCDWGHPGGDNWPCNTRAAVAAAKGDERD